LSPNISENLQTKTAGDAHLAEARFLREEQTLNKAESLTYRAATRIIIIIIIIIAPFCRILENPNKLFNESSEFYEHRDSLPSSKEVVNGP
jgi:hypothetical protein